MTYALTPETGTAWVLYVLNAILVPYQLRDDPEETYPRKRQHNGTTRQSRDMLARDMLALASGPMES